MKGIGNFFKGMVLLVLGALLWIVASILAAVAEVTGEPFPLFQFFMVIGFSVMILGPILYWFVVPLRNWASKRTSFK